MKKAVTFEDLLNFNSEKFRTAKNWDKVQVIYKPKNEVIGELTVSEDHSPSIVFFEEGGVHFNAQHVETVAEACHVLLKRKYNF